MVPKTPDSPKAQLSSDTSNDKLCEWMNEGISDVHAFPLLWRDMTASSTNDYTGHFSTKVVMAASFPS